MIDYTVVIWWIDLRYHVSAGGDVFGPSDKRLKPNVSNSGYAQVRLPVKGKWKWFSVARIVLRAFSGVEGEQVNHKNGLKTDNRLENLEWCTASQNMRHCIDVLGRRTNSEAMTGRVGAKCPNSKPVEQLTKDGTLVRVWPALAEARRHGFSSGNISAVCRGERTHHAGYLWRFH